MSREWASFRFGAHFISAESKKKEITRIQARGRVKYS